MLAPGPPPGFPMLAPGPPPGFPMLAPGPPPGFPMLAPGPPPGFPMLAPGPPPGFPMLAPGPPPGLPMLAPGPLSWARGAGDGVRGAVARTSPPLSVPRPGGNHEDLPPPLSVPRPGRTHEDPPPLSPYRDQEGPTLYPTTIVSYDLATALKAESLLAAPTPLPADLPSGSAFRFTSNP
uniref:WW domain-binding protein 11-like n=1 Tax=Petromyzon marinus TaxID=7757 RepID=A0AAJ7TTI2_PETMA|nr:WW domain-binding protein 11-like [Petromyzon marinus]